MNKSSTTAVVLLLLGLFFGCDPKENILPSAPAGEFTIGGEWNEIAGDAVEMPDGSWLIIGGQQTDESLVYDMVLIKIDAFGKELWTRRFSELDSDQYGRYIIPVDGGYAALSIQGQANSSLRQLWFVLFDDDFNVVERYRVTTSQAFTDLQFGVGGFFTTGGRSIQMPILEASGLSVYQTDPQGQYQEPLILPLETSYAYNIEPSGYFGSRPDSNYYLIYLTYPESDPDGTFLNRSYELFLLDRNYENIGTTGYDLPGQNMQISASLALADGSILIAFYDRWGNNNVIHVIGPSGQLEQEITVQSPPVRAMYWQPDSTVLAFTGLGGMRWEDSSFNNNDGDFGVFRIGQDFEVEELGDFGGNQHERLLAVKPARDGRYLMLGYTQSYGAGGIDVYGAFFQP